VGEVARWPITRTEEWGDRKDQQTEDREGITLHLDDLWELLYKLDQQELLLPSMNSRDKKSPEQGEADSKFVGGLRMREKGSEKKWEARFFGGQKKRSGGGE